MERLRKEIEIDKGLRKWASEIKEMIERRIGKDADVWMINGTPYNKEPNVISIGITFCEGQVFWFSLHQVEYNKNNSNQRRSLAYIRRQNMLATIEDFRKKLLGVIRKLK